MIKRPEKIEYAEYYDRYVSLVEENDIIAVLENQQTELTGLLEKISEKKSLYAYAEGKWTIKESIGHLTDGERIFAYRALRISRADLTPIEGFEQDGYIENSNFNATMFSDLIEELLLCRKSNLIFFKNLAENAWLRTGTASGHPVSVRALAYIHGGTYSPSSENPQRAIFDSMKYDAIIIGAGAAGLFCAAQAGKRESAFY